jgi:hypothetical protein
VAFEGKGVVEVSAHRGLPIDGDLDTAAFDHSQQDPDHGPAGKTNHLARLRRRCG